MKRFVAVFLSMFVALGITLGTGCALGGRGIVAEGHGALEVAFSSSPRFPLVGEEAVLTFIISFNDGTPGAGQEVMVMMAKTETEEEQADMAGMDHGAPAEEPAPMIHLMPTETSPGVYVAKHTFEEGGEYTGTVQIGDEVTEVTVAVRSSPIAWPFIIGLAGISALLAGVVAVIKTVRKEW